MILLAIIILWILFKLWLNGSDVSKDNNKNIIKLSIKSRNTTIIMLVY